ncbi:hypothetical protein Y032_0183g907 [Ancylostoma ceylanicum]|uniref:Uncharacterized protein n=1 Tax=Ancylostoma ceylanicum TaxID=53326 RepID=A0A016SRG5_9BILA|nr:hypothetical protein Y032_0183g907 [Ancylostoma ceylanicum]
MTISSDLCYLYGSYLLPSVPKRPRRAKVMPTSPAEPISEAAHDCNELCDRVRALTPEVLTAPLEKPYEPVRGSRRDAVARPSIGPEAKNMISLSTRRKRSCSLNGTLNC